MEFARQLTKEKLEELLSIIERNRWERLKKRQEESGVETEEEPPEAPPESVKVVFFGAESPFSDSMIKMFGELTGILFFDDPEKMIAFCMNFEIKAVLLDIDPPSNSSIVRDVFASLKMLFPISKLFICTSRKTSLETQHFKMFDAKILVKPILRKQVQEFFDQYLSK